MRAARDDEALERDRRDPPIERIAAESHFLDDARERMRRHRDAGQVELGHQQIERRNHDRRMVNGDHDRSAVNAGPEQHCVKGRGPSRGVDRSMRAAAASQITDRRNPVAGGWVEH
jgi:hypothetical protein